MKPRFLLLDIDGVLQLSNPDFRASIEADYAFQTGYMGFLHALFDREDYLLTLEGKVDLFPVLQSVLEDHVPSLDAATFFDKWLAEGSLPNEGLLDMIPRFSFSGVFLASNQEEHRGAHLKKLYQDLPGIDGIFMSYDLGCQKPDSKFFETVLASLNIGPREALFVDDNQRCTDGAEAVGIQSIRYESNEQLLRAMSAV